MARVDHCFLSCCLSHEMDKQKLYWEARSECHGAVGVACSKRPAREGSLHLQPANLVACCHADAQAPRLLVFFGVGRRTWVSGFCN